MQTLCRSIHSRSSAYSRYSALLAMALLRGYGLEGLSGIDPPGLGLGIIRDGFRVAIARKVRKMAKKGIPGLSFSPSRTLGVDKVKRKIAKATSIPTTKQSRQRKIGKILSLK